MLVHFQPGNRHIISGYRTTNVSILKWPEDKKNTKIEKFILSPNI